jgi:hypothetical protein
MVAASVLLVLPGLAVANPGSPGLDSAAQGVYASPGLGVGVLGAESPGSDQGIGVEGPTSSAADESDGLPFTGLTAVLVLAAGLVFLVAGAALRTVARRSRVT